MAVNTVPTMGWTRRSAAETLLQVTREQREEFARRVARLMEQSGLTNEALAYKSGLSVKTISRIVNARHEPRIGTIEALAQGLEVGEDALRPTPPPPLGLGVQPNGLEQRLERIEGVLSDVLALLSSQAVERPAPQPPGELGRRVSEADSKFEDPAPTENRPVRGKRQAGR